MRVPDEAALGQADVTISLEGWPEGGVVASAYRLSVVPRNPVPNIKVSPEQQGIWSADGYSVDELGYTPDGKTLVIVIAKPVQGQYLYQFRLWDTATGKERGKIFQIDPEPNLYRTAGDFLTLSPDSKFLAIRYNLNRFVKEGEVFRRQESGNIHVFDLQTGRQLWHNEGKGWSVIGGGFSPDSQTLVSSHYLYKETGKGLELKNTFTGAVRFWDAANGNKKANLPGGPLQAIGSVQYSPDGRYVVFQDNHISKQGEYYMGVWDLSANKLVFKTQAQNPVAAFSPGGAKIAISSCSLTGLGKTYRGTVKVWDIDNFEEKASLTIPTAEGFLSWLTWSSDGKYIYFSSNQGQLWRWDQAGSGQLVKVESIITEPSAKQPKRDARNQDFNLGSSLFALGVNGVLPRRITRKNLAEDYDELPPPEIVLWDLKTMQRRGTLTGHHGKMKHIAFSPDGKTLVSGGSDGTVRFWSMAGFQGK